MIHTVGLRLGRGMIACSCGVPGCPELGWPHEWDPIVADDDCMLGHGPGSGGLRAFEFGTPDPAFMRHDFGGYGGPMLEVRHAVRRPYRRWGSGYACAACVKEECSSLDLADASAREAGGL